MALNLDGVWKHDRSENFDDFLKAMDIGAVKRKMANSVSPTITIKQDGDNFEIITKAAMKTEENKLTIGKEQTRKVPPNDYEMKVVPSIEGDALVLTMTPIKDGKAHKVTRRVVNGELVMEIAVGDVKARRIFKRSS